MELWNKYIGKGLNTKLSLALIAWIGLWIVFQPKPTRKEIAMSKTSGGAVSTPLFFQCACCTPAKNLIPRPDINGLAADAKHAVVAVCLISNTQLSIYVWDGTSYQYRSDLIMSDR